MSARPMACPLVARRPQVISIGTIEIIFVDRIAPRSQWRDVDVAATNGVRKRRSVRGVARERADIHDVVLASRRFWRRRRDLRGDGILPKCPSPRAGDSL